MFPETLNVEPRESFRTYSVSLCSKASPRVHVNCFMSDRICSTVQSASRSCQKPGTSLIIRDQCSKQPPTPQSSCFSLSLSPPPRSSVFLRFVSLSLSLCLHLINHELTALYIIPCAHVHVHVIRCKNASTSPSTFSLISFSQPVGVVFRVYFFLCPAFPGVVFVFLSCQHRALRPPTPPHHHHHHYPPPQPTLSL